MTGNENGNVLQRIQHLIWSFESNNIGYAISHGIKPPKHITLPFVLKSLTGNVELVSILNCLCHSVLHSQAEEIYIVCFRKLVMADEVALPANIYTGGVTTLAHDNTDQLEKTVNGERISHRVNRTAFQSKHFNSIPHLPRKLPMIEKMKKRSISSLQRMLLTHNAGQQKGPPQTKSRDIILLQHVQYGRICFPITVPATQTSTIYELFNQYISMKQSLQPQKIMYVSDQVLYAKVADVMWKIQGKFSNSVSVWMGVFHTTCILMSIIGKIFRDARLHDL